MVDTKLTDLTEIVSGDISDISSFFLYGVNGGGSRKVLPLTYGREIITGLTKINSGGISDVSSALLPIVNGGVFGSIAPQDIFPEMINGQVKFPATQNPSSDANTLDDYEEGTFTPVLNFGGATTGITYSKQLGYYRKVGSLVLFSITIYLTSKGTATGAMTITGLPFQSLAVTDLYQAMGLTPDNMAASVVYPCLLVGYSGTTIYGYNLTGGSRAALTDAEFNNNTTMYITGSYIANA